MSEEEASCCIESLNAIIDGSSISMQRFMEEVGVNPGKMEASEIRRLAARLNDIVLITYQRVFCASNSHIQAVLLENGIIQPYDANEALDRSRQCVTALKNSKFCHLSRNQVEAMPQSEKNDYRDALDEYEAKVAELQDANALAKQIMQDQCTHYAKMARRRHYSNMAKITGAVLVVLGAVAGAFMINNPSVVKNAVDSGSELMSQASKSPTAKVAVLGVAAGTTVVVTGIKEYDKYTQNLEWLEQQKQDINTEFQKNDLDIGNMQRSMQRWHKVLEEFEHMQEEIKEDVTE